MLLALVRSPIQKLSLNAGDFFSGKTNSGEILFAVDILFPATIDFFALFAVIDSLNNCELLTPHVFVVLGEEASIPASLKEAPFLGCLDKENAFSLVNKLGLGEYISVSHG